MEERTRQGFTLVEFLVVVSIVSILLALLLPAVQWARESARTATCNNRLRQIGLATLNFEASHGELPSNGWGYKWIADPRRGYGVKQPGGWIYHIAVFCELGLPDSASATPIAQWQNRTELSRTEFSMLRCPSRGSPNMSPATRDFYPVNASFLALVPKADFAANEGDHITDTDGGPKNLREGDSSSYKWTSTERTTGVIFLRSAVQVSEILDGLSNTYLLGEKYVNSQHYHDNLDDGYDQSLFSGVDLDINRWTTLIPMKDTQRDEVRRFGSAHAAACGMVMCDGAVRRISYSIDHFVHRTSGNRYDQSSN